MGDNNYFLLRRIFIVLAVILVVYLALPKEVRAAEVVETWDISATESDDVKATLYDDGLLEISGSGKMTDWDGYIEVPWSDNVLKMKIDKVEIQNGVTNIGNFALSYNFMKNIKISDSVVSIGEHAFEACSGLTNIEIPNSIEKIGKHAFDMCSNLISIEIPNSVTSIGEYAFEWCTSTVSVELPNNIKCIENGTFFGCRSLTDIEIPNSVTSIGDAAFSKCSELKEIKIPNNVTNIGDRMFEYCENLTSIEISNGITDIGNWTFSNCKGLTSIHIPSNVERIGKYAFCWCNSLKYIEIPNSVMNIDESSFGLCTSLEKAIISNASTSIGQYAFYLCSDNLTIHCYKNSTADTYAKDNNIPVVYLDGGESLEPEQIKIKDNAKYVKNVLTINNTKYIIIDKLTKVEELLQDFEVNTQEHNLVINDNASKTLSNTDIIKTNQRLGLEGSEDINMIISVKGDLNSDGIVDLKDLVKLNNYRIDKSKTEKQWTSAEKIAFKALKSTEITDTDIAQVTFRDIASLNNYRISK